jgi:hypothetical protein
MVWLQITWQTGATSEHRLQRRVRSYTTCANMDLLECRIRKLNQAGKMDHEIAAILNAEGIMSARGVPFLHGTIHLLRKQWGIRTVKINGDEANPLRWPDGSYSIQGAAAALGITAQTVFKWLRKGRSPGTPAGERSALADHSANRSDQCFIPTSTTHQTISIGGIMKYSVRRTRPPIRRRTSWW